jgi:phosphate starvation-inducible PhoH-like protein
LPGGIGSGLREASKVLAGVKGIGIVRMAPVDVIRHDVVARIVEAYGNYEAGKKSSEKVLEKQEK